MQASDLSTVPAELDKRAEEEEEKKEEEEGEEEEDARAEPGTSGGDELTTLAVISWACPKWTRSSSTEAKL